MREEHKDEISRLFHTVKLQTGIIKQQLKSVEDEDARFYEKFRKLCEDCLIPTIKDVGEQIREMGGDYQLEEFHETRLKELGIGGKPFLKFTISVPGPELQTSGRAAPCMIFTGDKYRNKVSCKIENIGHLTTADHQTLKLWNIDEITSDKVEKAVITYMKVMTLD